MSDKTDWFRNEAGDVTHWCNGVATNEEVIERYKKGVRGNIKHKDTHIEISKWFYPAPLKEDQARAEAGLKAQHVCQACGKTSPDLSDPTTIGDPDENA
jgi:hypothetical protein